MKTAFKQMNDLSKRLKSIAPVNVRIKTIRQFLGLTQEELAQALGVSTISILRWENGQAEPCASKYLQIEAMATR
jgi:DNA-binding transcriptional regulator YiaG